MKAIERPCELRGYPEGAYAIEYVGDSRGKVASWDYRSAIAYAKGSGVMHGDIPYLVEVIAIDSDGVCRLVDSAGN